jgi:hypothetical protein
MRWLQVDRNYFRIDWGAIRLVVNDPTGLTLKTTIPEPRLTEALGQAIWVGKRLCNPAMILFTDLQYANPLVVDRWSEESEQADLVLANLRADLQWAELTSHAAGEQEGSTATSSLFVRLVDVQGMQEDDERPFHGPDGQFALPAGITVTLTNGLALGTWIRAVGEVADRLRRMVREDWRPEGHPIGNPLV